MEYLTKHLVLLDSGSSTNSDITFYLVLLIFQKELFVVRRKVSNFDYKKKKQTKRKVLLIN